MDPTSEQETAPRARRSFAPAILLTVLLGSLIVLWGSVAGVLVASGDEPADRATKLLTEVADDLDRAAGLLEEAGTVAQLREAGAAIGDMQRDVLDVQRRLAALDDRDVADTAVRANRDMTRVLEGWAQLAALDDEDPGAWPRQNSERILKATNRLRDGDASKARRLASSGETPVDIDHSRARAVTLKVARFLTKADRRRGRV